MQGHGTLIYKVISKGHIPFTSKWPVPFATYIIIFLGLVVGVQNNDKPIIFTEFKKILNEIFYSAKKVVEWDPI